MKVSSYSAEEDSNGIPAAVESFVVKGLMDVPYELVFLRTIK
jgi:hypothetical protein